MNSLRIKCFALPEQLQKLSGQFATREFERGRSCNDYEISIRFDSALIRSDRFPYASFDSVALDGIPKPLACHNPHLAPTASNRACVNGQIPVRLSCPGSVYASEFVLFC